MPWGTVPPGAEISLQPCCHLPCNPLTAPLQVIPHTWDAVENGCGSEQDKGHFKCCHPYRQIAVLVSGSAPTEIDENGQKAWPFKKSVAEAIQLKAEGVILVTVCIHHQPEGRACQFMKSIATDPSYYFFV